METGTPDSIVYRTTVSKPVHGWGELYLAIFSKDYVDNSWGSHDITENWDNAIRPEEQWLYTHDGDDYSGLDATALHGGLFAKGKSRANQAINPVVSEDITSYTFSMNVTTSTYRIILNPDNLYIMGPAVNDGDDESGWSTDNPYEDTPNALKLTYVQEEKCYKRLDGDGNETAVMLGAGKTFAFAYNKNFSNTFFEEDAIVPVDLSGTSDYNKEAVAYNVIENNRYETQYVNFLHIGNPGTAAHTNNVKDCTFNLPTGEYIIRLYIRTSPVNPDQSQVYYLIRRAYTFSCPAGADNIGNYDTYKTFCDYHAVVIPDGIDALYVSGSDKENRTVTLTQYPLYAADNDERVLPAGAPVILAKQSEGTDAKQIVDLYYYGEPNFAEVNYEEKPAANLLTGQVHSAQIAKESGEKANFLFACKKINDTDEKPAIGFFLPGTYNCPINLAYLQLEKDFLGGGSTLNSKAWRLVLDGGTTGIAGIDTGVSYADNGYYTLQGVKVGKPSAKGIYIHNGRKMIIR